VRVDASAVVESIRLLREGVVCNEIRTTYSPLILKPEDLRGIAAMIQGCQRFRPTKALDPAALAIREPSPEEMEAARLVFESAGIAARLR
jgi:hypothetical protein